MTKEDIKQEFYESYQWLDSVSMTDSYINWLENKIIEMDERIIKEI